MQEGDQEEEDQLPTILSSSVGKTPCVEPLVVYHLKSITDCIPEEVLGVDR